MRAQVVRVLDGDAVLRRGDVLERWRSDPLFCDAFTAALAATPYAAFLWETPPISASTVDEPFEMALVDAPALARFAPEPEAFAAHIDDGRGTQEVRTFANLGADALLVAPCAGGALEHYTHLAAFARSGARSQARGLWQAVSEAVEERLPREGRVWVSTNGMGVAWLHVRVDRRPKYYSFARYR